MSTTTRNYADVMREVEKDCATDATALDSTPFTPRGIGETFGNTLAMLAAVAHACAVAHDRIASLEQMLAARTEDSA